MNHDDRTGTIADLVAHCLALKMDGVADVPYESVCAEHPEFINEVRAGVERAARLPDLHASAAGRDRFVGSVLGNRYSITDRLGSGAMGVVYAATDMDLGREVAIKLVHTGILARDSVLARFEREATALAAVSHPSIVTIFDRGLTDEQEPFIVMERIDGVQCSEILEQATLQPDPDSSEWLGEYLGLDGFTEPSFIREAIRWTADLASGLEAAHAAGVVHRDVKPSNVMIRRDGTAVLLDFGIAATEDQVTLTRTDAAIGTPAYMAPEVLSGKGVGRPSQDVYGLSATLYHLLTLRPPYSGSSQEALAALATREPERAVKVRPGLTRDVQAILDHGLARRPSARYPSAAAIEKDLRHLLAFRPVSVRPTSTLTRWARRAWRSKVVIGALAASLILVTAFFVRARNIEADARAVVAHREAWNGVPVNIGIVNPANRVYAKESVNEAIGTTLDRLVESGHQPVSARMVRALYLWDHGATEASLRDFGAISKLAGTPYAAALADRYSHAAETGEALASHASLPEPDTEGDLYLATYEAIRAGDLPLARELAASADSSKIRHWKELRLVLKVAALGKVPREERVERAIHLLEEIESFEISSGWTSPATAHQRSYCHDLAEEPERAILAASEALAMSPYSAATLQMQAEALFNSFELEDAEMRAREALELLPDYRKIRVVLAKILAQQLRFTEALEVVDGTVFGGSRARQEEEASIRGYVYLVSAIDKHLNQVPGAQRDAESALALTELMKSSNRVRQQIETYGPAILGGDLQGLTRSVLLDLIEEPEASRFLHDLNDNWPAEIDSETSELLHRWISELVALQDRRHLRSKSGL